MYVKNNITIKIIKCAKCNVTRCIENCKIYAYYVGNKPPVLYISVRSFRYFKSAK